MEEPMDDGSDVILRCGDDQYLANRFKLSSVSPYFRSMFTSEWLENTTGLITMPAVRGNVMKVLLEFAHGTWNSFNDEQESDNFLMELAAAAHLLQFDTVFDLCVERLEACLNLGNFRVLFSLSHLYGNTHLASCIENFLAKNIKELVKCGDLLELTKDQLQAIYCNPAFVKSLTDHIVRGLIIWSGYLQREHDPNARETEMLDLLTFTIDLNYLSTDYLTALLKNKTFVTRNQQITALFMAEALTRSVTTVQRSRDYSNATKLYCFGKNNEKQVVRIYDIDSNMWSEGKDIPFELEYGMAVIGHGIHIYFFGRGEVDRVSPSKTVVKYCPETNSASTTGSLKFPVFMAQAGLVYEAIYLIGGMNKQKKVVTTVQRYSPATGHCEEVAPTNKKHSWPYVFAHENHLYIASCKNNSTKNMERYDVLTDQWTMMMNIPGSFRAAFSGLKLYSIQKTVDTAFQVYDVSTETQSVSKFTGGPYEIFELWAAKKRGRPVLIARDRENILHWYDIESCRWDTTLVPNHLPWHGWQTCTL